MNLAEFTNHPFIASIADSPIFTLTEGKKPLDMRALMRMTDQEFTGFFKGAKYHDERCLASLPEIDGFLAPYTQNSQHPAP